MPIVRPQAHCLSYNAFNPRRALYSALNSALTSTISRRSISSVERKETAENEVTSSEEDDGKRQTEKTVEVAAEKPTINISPRPATSRLTDELRKIRERNRQSLISRVKDVRPGEEKIAVPEDATKEERAELAAEKLKITWLNSIVPNKTIRPRRVGSHLDADFESPMSNFKDGKPVFQKLRFYGDLSESLTTAKNISTVEGEILLDYQGCAVKPVRFDRRAEKSSLAPWAQGIEEVDAEAR